MDGKLVVESVVELVIWKLVVGHVVELVGSVKQLKYLWMESLLLDTLLNL